MTGLLALAWTAENIIAVECLAIVVVLLVAGWASGDSLAEMLGLVDPPEWDRPDRPQAVDDPGDEQGPSLAP